MRRDRAAPGDDEDLRARRAAARCARPARRSPRRAARPGSRPSTSCGSRAGRRSSTGSRRRTWGRRSRPRAGRRRAARASAASPSSTGPAYMPATRTTGSPWSSSGSSGSGGQVTAMKARPSSSGASRCRSRNRASSSRKRSARWTTRPAKTSGPSGCSASSSAHTTPKLPPPPRSAQNRSACSMADARTSRPSAVTTSAATRLSQARPCLRSSQPEPPPSVRPATPVVETRPPVVARPWLLRGAVDLRPGGAAAHAGDPRLGVDARRRPSRGRRGRGRPRTARGPPRSGRRPRTATRQVLVAGEGERRDDVVGRRAAGDVARPRLDHRVEQLAGVGVLGMARDVEAAAQAEAQLVGGGQDRHGPNATAAQRATSSPIPAIRFGPSRL